MNTSTNAEKVDQLGKLKAKIAVLKKTEKMLENELKSAKLEVIAGKQFRCTVSSYSRKTVAWEKIAKQLSASIQMISGNTSRTPATKILIKAHKK